MCILNFLSTTSDKLANEVFEAWQEIGTEKRRLDKARTMCCSRPDDICTARINTSRKRKFNLIKNMGMYSIRGLLHWLYIVALMRDVNTESTLAAKKEFEHRCAVRGVKVEH